MENEIEIISRKVIKDCEKYFKKIFNSEMDNIIGDRKILDGNGLIELKDYCGVSNKWNKNGFRLHKRLQIEMRLFIGSFYGIRYYILNDEELYFNRMKDKDLNKNDFIYSYLMKSKRDKSNLPNYLFKVKDNEVGKSNFDKKFNVYKRGEIYKRFFKIENDINIHTYNLLENLTEWVYNYTYSQYNINIKWYYNKESFKNLKKNNYDEYLFSLYCKIVGWDNEIRFNEFKFSDWEKKINGFIYRKYCNKNDVRNLKKWINNKCVEVE